MTADERIVSLEDQLKRALERVHLLEEQLAAAQKRIEELEKQKTPPLAYVNMSTITREGTRWFKPCWARTSRECWAATSTRPTISIRGCISEARVHVLRDGHDLKEQSADDATVREWFTQVKARYQRARAYVGPDPALPPARQAAGRTQQQHAFEQELWQLCAPYAHTALPLQTLCHRVERFLLELFVFVARPEVPPDNNLVERSVRPLVIARKISGGSRSPTGSQTRMALFSCLGTWAAEATQSVLAMPGLAFPANPLG